MPKVVFISYANEAMAYSLKRIGYQARRMGVFDEIILYTPSDMPDYVKESPLFTKQRGAGYWCWKPAIIYETLANNEDGTIVVYIDAGCTLRKSPKWNELLGLMSRYETIVFQYGEYQPQWKELGSESSKIKYWTKKKTLDYLIAYTGDKSIGELCTIMGGCIFMKGKKNEFLRRWLEITFQHPELIEDPGPIELLDQNMGFSGHRHDQSILTPLANTDMNTLVLPEIMEKYSRKSFIWASRIRARNLPEFIIVQIKHYLRIYMGDTKFEKFKAIFK